MNTFLNTLKFKNKLRWEKEPFLGSNWRFLFGKVFELSKWFQALQFDYNLELWDAFSGELKASKYEQFKGFKELFQRFFKGHSNVL